MALPSWLTSVKDIFDKDHVPWPVWLAIAWEESSLNPSASNTVPPDDSWGLFALNRAGGQGHGHTAESLKNPVTNATIAAGSIQGAVQKCGPDDIICIAINSGHPTETGHLPAGNPLPQRIKRTYDYIKDANTLSDAVAMLNEGKLPDPDQGDGSGVPASDIVSMISDAMHAWGDAFIKGVGTGVKESWGKLEDADRTVKTHFWSAAIGYTSSVTLIGFGLIGMVLESPPAKLAAQIGQNVGPAPVRIASAGAAMYQGKLSAGGAVSAARKRVQGPAKIVPIRQAGTRKASP